MALKYILILYIIALFTTSVFSSSYSYVNFQVPKVASQTAALIEVGDIELSDDQQVKLTLANLQVIPTVDGTSIATQATFNVSQTASLISLRGIYTKDSAIISYFRFKTPSIATNNNPKSVAATVGCRVFGDSFTGVPQPTARVNFFFPGYATCKQVTGAPLKTTMVFYSQMRSSIRLFSFSQIQLNDDNDVSIDAADVKVTAYNPTKKCTTDDPLKPASNAQTCPENAGYIFQLTNPNVTVRAMNIFPSAGSGGPFAVFISMEMDSPELSFNLSLPTTASAYGSFKEIKF